MIRPMRKDDRAAVRSLIEATQFFRPDEIEVAEELIDVYLHHPNQKDYDIVVVETPEGDVAGYMAWGTTPLTLGTYDLYWMAIAPGHQRKKYGRQLVEWLEAKVKSLGGRIIIIETSSTPKYEPTRRFYLGLDYREIARLPEFYAPGDDRVIYMKRMV